MEKKNLNVEVGWKHFTGGKFIQVKKGKVGAPGLSILTGLPSMTSVCQKHKIFSPKSDKPIWQANGHGRCLFSKLLHGKD